MGNKNIKILIIDDIQDNLTTLQANIKDAFPESHVLQALNGAHGVEIAKKEDPDVILLDIVMPGMDGFEVCRKLKEDKKLREIPVAFITALKGDSETRIRALECGVEVFLNKPIDIYELTAQIHSMVKIRNANNLIRNENKRLAKMVEQKTKELTIENKARKESEESLLEVQRLAHIGSFVFDVGSKMLKCTSEALNLCGIKQEDFNGTRDTSIRHIHPDDREYALRQSAKAVSKKRTVEYECRLISSDGEERTVHVSIGAIFDKSGAHIKTHGTIQNITERKKFEFELKESEEKFKYVFDNSVIGKSLTLPSGELKVNKAMCTMLGYSEEELENKKWQEITHHDDIDFIEKKTGDLVSGKIDSLNLTKRYIKKDGSILWANLQTSLRRDKDGKPLYFISSIVDITERMIAQQSLQKSEEKYRLLITQMTQGIAMHEVILDEEEKVIDYRFIDVNYGFEELTGLKRENIIGKTVLEVLPGTEQSWIEKYGQVAMTGETLIFEDYSKELAKYYEVIAYSPKPKQFATIFTDITKRNQTEERLKQQNEELFESQRIAHIGTWRWDLTTDQVVWTDELYRMYGLDPKKLPPPFSEHMKLFTPDSWEKLSVSIERARTSGIPYELELKTIKADGSNGWMWVRGEAIKDESGNIIALWGATQDITVHKESEDLLKEMNRLLGLRLLQTINAISKIIELRDVYTAGHQRNVADLSCAIAKELGLSEEKISNISNGALIHDIGKINIASDILNKPGKISDLEYQVLQTHAEFGYEIVKGIDFPIQVIEMIHQHHERLDGSGYPQKLAGDQIILESRILAVADVVEAMTSHRPYRPALGIEFALEEISLYKGKKYDCAVVDACVTLFREKGFQFTIIN